MKFQVKFMKKTSIFQIKKEGLLTKIFSQFKEKATTLQVKKVGLLADIFS